MGPRKCYNGAMEEERTLEFFSGSEQDTKRLGEALAAALGRGAVILLKGDLAAGKTALARSIFAYRGFEKGFCSPTFSIVNVYEREGALALHADLYRLGDAEELVYTGFYDMLGDADITVVEWPELISEEMGDTSTVIDIDILPEPGERMFHIRVPDGETCLRLKEELNAGTGC